MGTLLFWSQDKTLGTSLLRSQIISEINKKKVLGKKYHKFKKKVQTTDIQHSPKKKNNEKKYVPHKPLQYHYNKKVQKIETPFQIEKFFDNNAYLLLGI